MSLQELDRARLLASTDLVSLYLNTDKGEFLRELRLKIDPGEITESDIDRAVDLFHREGPGCCHGDDFFIQLADNLNMKEKALRMAEDSGYLNYGIRIAKEMGDEISSERLYMKARGDGNPRFVAECAKEFGDHDWAIEMYALGRDLSAAINLAYDVGKKRRAMELCEQGGYFLEGSKIAKELGDKKKIIEICDKGIRYYKGPGNYDYHYKKTFKLRLRKMSAHFLS